MIARARVHIQASALGYVCFRHLASAPTTAPSVGPILKISKSATGVVLKQIRHIYEGNKEFILSVKTPFVVAMNGMIARCVLQKKIHLTL